MRLVYHLNSENSDPLDKEFLSKSRKIKNRLLKEGFIGKNDAIAFVPTSHENQLFTLPE